METPLNPGTVIPVKAEESGRPARKINPEKIIGYILVASGLALILVSTVLLVNVLTGKSKPYQVFNVESPTINLPTSNLEVKAPENLKLPEGFSINQKKEEQQSAFKIIPDELLNGTVNIGLFYLMAMFLTSVGAKIAGIGVSMIKEVKVKIEKENLKS